MTEKLNIQPIDIEQVGLNETAIAQVDEINSNNKSHLRRWLRLGTSVLAAGSLAYGYAPQIKRDYSLVYPLIKADIEAKFSRSNNIQLESTANTEALSEDYDLLQLNSVGNGLYRQPGQDLGLTYAQLWQTEVIENAEYDTSLVTGNQNAYTNFLKTLNATNIYWGNGSKNNPAGYYRSVPELSLTDGKNEDDNLWQGLILMRQYSHSKNRQQLVRSKEIFSLITSQWDKDGGGVYEQEQVQGVGSSRCVVSNAPAVLLGVELYKETGDPYYLEWSKKIYNWLDNALLDKNPNSPSYNLFFDHITAKTISVVIRTYVEGTMIAAGEALNSIEPETYPLSREVKLAETSLTYFQSHHSYGNTAFDLIFFSDELPLAAKCNNEQLTEESEQGLNLAIESIPNKLNSLTQIAGAIGERALKLLSLTQDLQLLPSSDFKQKVPGTGI